MNYRLTNISQWNGTSFDLQMKVLVYVNDVTHIPTYIVYSTIYHVNNIAY